MEGIMKKALLVILALVMVLTLSIGSVSVISADGDRDSYSKYCPVAKNNGAFVEIQGYPVAGKFKYEYGWRDTKRFASPPAGYWIGLYNITDSHYEWSTDYQFPANGTMKSLEVEFCDNTNLVPGKKYYINFFVRGTYVDPVTNVAEISLEFTAK
jgi:hypothetical protein